MVYVTFKNGEVQSYSSPNGSTSIRQDTPAGLYKIFYKKGQSEILIAYIRLDEMQAISFKKPVRVMVPNRRIEDYQINQLKELLGWWGRERVAKHGRVPMYLDSAINTLTKLVL